MIAKHEKQRARQGYSVFDWWSFDTFVATLIANGVEDFRKNGHGRPAQFTTKEWNKLLKSIEKPLRRYGQDKFSSPHAFSDVLKDAQKAMKLFSENLGSMWD